MKAFISRTSSYGDYSGYEYIDLNDARESLNLPIEYARRLNVFTERRVTYKGEELDYNRVYIEVETLQDLRSISEWAESELVVEYDLAGIKLEIYDDYRE